MDEKRRANKLVYQIEGFAYLRSVLSCCCSIGATANNHSYDANLWISLSSKPFQKHSEAKWNSQKLRKLFANEYISIRLKTLSLDSISFSRSLAILVSPCFFLSLFFTHRWWFHVSIVYYIRWYMLCLSCSPYNFP